MQRVRDALEGIMDATREMDAETTHDSTCLSAIVGLARQALAVLDEIAQPTWSDKPPTEEGYYWMRIPSGRSHLAEVAPRSFGDSTLVANSHSGGPYCATIPVAECSPLWEWLLIPEPPEREETP